MHTDSLVMAHGLSSYAHRLASYGAQTLVMHTDSLVMHTDSLVMAPGLSTYAHRLTSYGTQTLVMHTDSLVMAHRL